MARTNQRRWLPAIALPVATLVLVGSTVLVFRFARDDPNAGVVSTSHGASQSRDDAMCQKPARALRLAALAPKNSMLGKIFIAWKRAFAQKLDGRFELEVIYGEREHEETTVVQALLSDRLDGALLTIAGLRAIHADFGLLTIPGWIDSWEALEDARAELGSHLDARLDARGLKRVAWYDVGLVRLMSRGVPLDDPKQLVDRGAWTSPVVGVAGLFGTKSVDWNADFGASKVTIAPMAERSWSHHDRVHAIPVLAAGGALVVRKRALDCMPAEAQTVWAETAVEVVRFFRRSREREQELFEKAPRSYLSVVEPANASAARWREALRREGEEYMRGFPPELVERVRRAVGNGATHVSTFTGDPQR